MATKIEPQNITLYPGQIQQFKLVSLGTHLPAWRGFGAGATQNADRSLSWVSGATLAGGGLYALGDSGGTFSVTLTNDNFPGSGGTGKLQFTALDTPNHYCLIEWNNSGVLTLKTKAPDYFTWYGPSGSVGLYGGAVTNGVEYSQTAPAGFTAINFNVGETVTFDISAAGIRIIGMGSGSIVWTPVSHATLGGTWLPPIAYSQSLVLPAISSTPKLSPPVLTGDWAPKFALGWSMDAAGQTSTTLSTNTNSVNNLTINAGAFPGTYKLTVDQEDAGGQGLDDVVATITVPEFVVASATQIGMKKGEKRTIATSYDGKIEVTRTKTGGTFDGTTYTAPNATGTYTLTFTAAGQVRTVTVTVSPALTPEYEIVYPGEVLPLTTDMSGTVAWTLSAGGGALSTNSGTSSTWTVGQAQGLPITLTLTNGTDTITRTYQVLDKFPYYPSEDWNATRNKKTVGVTLEGGRTVSHVKSPNGLAGETFSFEYRNREIDEFEAVKTFWDKYYPDGLFMIEDPIRTKRYAAQFAGDLTHRMDGAGLIAYSVPLRVPSTATAAGNTSGSAVSTGTAVSNIVNVTQNINGITALTGDVTASGTGSVAATVATNAVTFAKMQTVASGTLLGRATAGTGNVEAITLGTGLSFTGTTLNSESSVTIPQMPTSGALGIWFMKDFDVTKQAVPNALGGTLADVITRNWRGVFETGKVGGAGGSGGWLGGGFDGMTVTEKYANGIDGVAAATRIVFASTANGLRYRQTISLPAGTYTMAIHAKSNTGSNQDFVMSHDGGTTTATKTATTTLQQFTNEFTLSSTTTVDLRFIKPTSGSGDFVIDKAFLWNGAASSVPSDLIDAGHLYLGNSSKSAIDVTNGELYLSGGDVGAIDLPTFTTSSETTILALVKRVTPYTNSAGYRYPFVYNIVEGATAGFDPNTGWSLGEAEGEGNLTATFGGRALTPKTGGFSPDLYADGGYHVISTSANSSAIDLWFDDLGLAGSYSTGASRTTRKWQIGNASSSFGLLRFKMAGLAIYSRKLTDEERRTAIAAMIAKAAETGVKVAKPTNLIVAGFDSITAGPLNNSYAQAYLANTSKPRSLFTQESIGSSTLTLNPTASLNLDTRMNAYGLVAIPSKAADRAGRKFIMALLPGANDLQPNYSGNVTNFLNALWAVTDPLRARGYVIGIGTILPKGTAVTGYATHNTARAAVNPQLRSLVGIKFDFLIDFAADPTMGTDAAANNTALYGDGRHPTATAHSTYLEPIYRAAIERQLNNDAITISANRIGLGATPNANLLINAASTSTALSGTTRGSMFSYQLNPASASSQNAFAFEAVVQSASSSVPNVTGTMTGFRTQAIWSSANTLTVNNGFVANLWNTSSGTVNYTRGADITIQNAGTGTSSNVSGLLVQMIAGSTGTVSTFEGISISGSKAGGATFTTSTGLRIANTGAATRYGVLVESSAGNSGFGTTTPTAQLQAVSDAASKVALLAQSASGATANVAEIVNSAGTGIKVLPSGALRFPSLADSAAEDDSTYYSTTQSKLVYKNSGGTVNVLY